MGLLESIAEDEAALKELEEQETEEQVEDVAEEEAVEEEPEQEEDTSDNEEQANDEDQAEEEVEEPKIDNAAFAQMRREKAALEKRLRDLENPTQTVAQEEDNQTDPNEKYLAEIVEEKKLNDARAHLSNIEEEFRKSTPEYDAVVTKYAQAVASSFRVNNPRMSQADLVKSVEKTMIEKAGQYYAQGLDPAEEIYNDALSLGFTGEQAQEAEKETVRKPSLDTIAKNKQRSAGMAGVSKGTGAVQTKSAALDMPLSEFAKIPASELERIERG